MPDDWAFMPEFLIKKGDLEVLSKRAGAEINSVSSIINGHSFEIDFLYHSEYVYKLRNSIVDTLTSTPFIYHESKYSPIRFAGAYWPSDLINVLSPNSKIEQTSGLWTSLSGRSYTHWLFEDLPRFLRIMETFPSIGIIVSPKSPKYVFDLIEGLRIDSQNILRSEIVKPEFLIYESIHDLNVMPRKKDLDDLIMRMKKISDTRTKSMKQYERIYVSRAKSPRSLEGERVIESNFARRGFKILYAEDLNLWDQIAIFSQVRILAGPHGSGLTNMIWSEKPILVLEIIDQSREESLYLQFLAEARGHSSLQLTSDDALQWLSSTLDY